MTSSFLLVNWHKIWSSSRDSVICLYFKVPVYFMRLILWVFELLHLCIPQFWWVFFLFLFLINIACLCHLSGERLCVWLSIYLSFGSFVCVPPLYILRMVQSTLFGRLLGRLFLWWDFYCRLIIILQAVFPMNDDFILYAF